MDRSAAAGATLAELAELSGATVVGDASLRVHRVATLAAAGEGDIAFLANPRYQDQLAASRATAVIVAPGAAGGSALPKLVSANPYATYARVAARLHPAPLPTPGIDPTAVVAPDARIAPSASIGPRAVIGAAAIVGPDAVVGAGSVIGAQVSIGAGALLHANVTVYDRCVIGPRTLVHSGAVIGADGFGMAEENGRWLRIPQIGRVVIGADCEVGANTTIDRGALDDTVIEDDVKLDNQIQIAHNCRIGRHTAIAGCVGIAGSTTIGRNCKLGGAAMVVGHIDIADGAVVSAGTLVFASITAPGVYTGVFPALPHAEWRRVAAQLRGLERLGRRVRALERAGGGDDGGKP